MSRATPSELAMLSRIGNRKEREFIESKLGIPLHKFSDFSSYLSTGHKLVWASYRSCKLIAAAMLSADFKIISVGGQSQYTLVQLPPPPVKGETDPIYFSSGGFIKNPNPYDSWEEFVEMTVFHLELTGNAYWLKDEIDLSGRPSALYPLLPHNMGPVPGKKEKVASYEYKVNGIIKSFKPEEIIHLKTTNPVNLMLGMGSIEPSQPLYNQFINKNNLDEKFVENGAQISGVLSREDAEGLDSEDWDRFKKKFNLDYAGKANAGKTAFLNGKWSYHRLGMNMAEMQALEREKWTVEQIFMNHGVPLSVAGIQGAANYATASQDERNFRKYKVVPLLDMIVGKINSEGFIQANDPNYTLVYEMSGLIDVDQIVKEMLPLLKAGVITRNELREKINMPIITDNPMMDELTVEMTTIPLALAGVGNPADSDLAPKETPKATKGGVKKKRYVKNIR